MRQASANMSIKGQGRPSNDIITTEQKASVFNKMCLSAKICSKAWSFERVPNHILFGYDTRVHMDISTVHECQDLCLNEAAFQCISGEYDYIGRRCYLSTESRRTQPASFRPATTSIDYFENQCIQDNSGCQYEEKSGVDLGFADLKMPAVTEVQCQDMCDQSQSFICRSFTFDVEKNECRLSSDDTLSAGVRALVKSPSTRYYQRTNCLDLKLLCTTEAMIVTLHSREPFTGRIYAKTIPGKCEVSGRGKDTTRLSMPLVATSMDSVCGIVAEGDGRYSNTVVVQHHPLIQRRGDREIKLLCLFESSSRTVSNSYSVVSNGLGSSATATVNATAPSPSIRLRITDKKGRDIKGTKLGAEIYLRIEIDDTSAFGIFARDLQAHSGNRGDSLTLLDENGCPVDPSIFPGLKKLENSKTLQGKFEAFKFSEDVVVRFTLNVQFCITDCQPAQCPTGITSYGKKRKKRQTFRDEKILPDYPLVGEIIVEGTTVTPLTDANEDLEQEKRLLEGTVCLSHAILIVAGVTIFVIIMCIVCACAVCLMVNRRRKDKEQRRPDYSLRIGSVFTNDTLTSIPEAEDQ
ncbi:Cuticlin-1 [Nymphon striatum]|nr:Cuticlin-1 [Nymphon striatum]